MIDYEIRVEDPDTFVKPWTIRMTVTQQPDYEIYEYGCHEGNNAMRNALSAERAYEKAAAEARPRRACRRRSACSSASTARIALVSVSLVVTTNHVTTNYEQTPSGVLT